MTTAAASFRPALVAVVAMLGSWLCAWRISVAAGQGDSLVVVAVMVAVTLSRSEARPQPTGVRALGRWAALAIAAVGAAGLGRILPEHAWVGGVLFAVAMGLSVWLRRYGGLWMSVAGVIGLPFVALLVAPVRPTGDGLDLWPALVALVAAAWVEVTHRIARRSGWLPVPARGVPVPPARRNIGRAALQMTLTVALSYALGRWLFPDHWAWSVLSGYVVVVGNRGRGDVLHKGVHRLTGALGGTIVATLVAGLFPAGDRWGLVVLFATIGLAIWVRPLAYAGWAAGVTAVVSLLYGYYGIGGSDVLLERLLALTMGAAIGVLVAWFVLPVRTRDVFRRRWADALAAVAGLIEALRTGEVEEMSGRRRALTTCLGRLDEIAPTWRLHGRTVGRTPRLPVPAGAGHPADLLRSLGGVSTALMRSTPDSLTPAGWGRAARTVGTLRHRMRGEDEREVVVPPGEVGAALADLERAFTREAWLALGGR